MTRVHDAFPDKNAYWTEGGPDITQPDYQTDFTNWADQFNGILNNWARSHHRMERRARRKGQAGYRTVLVRRRHHHRQRFAQDHPQRPVLGVRALLEAHQARGARLRDECAGRNRHRLGVSHTGFRNPDGSYVVVLANKGAEQQVQLLMGDQALDDVDLPRIPCRPALGR